MAFASFKWAARGLGLGIWLAGAGALAAADEVNASAEAERGFRQAQKRAQDQPQSDTVAWQLGRACFRLANFATNRTQRAELAQQGIAACQRSLAANSNSAPAHYYLGLNFGQLARTRTLGALRLVDQMEEALGRARELEPEFDHGGPDRVLGLLYLDAPAIGSIGSRAKAQEHLQLAIDLAPSYPDNRLSLIEAELRWGNRGAARRELKELEKIWPRAQTDFAGPAWNASWADWDSRLKTARRMVDQPIRLLEAPRQKP